MFKKIIMVVTLLINVLLACASAETLHNTTIEMQIGQNEAIINGEIYKIDENIKVVPFIKNDRTLVPLRFISENLNLHVQWEAETQSVTLADENTEIILKINNTIASVNGNAYALDVCPVLKNERTFVPVRFVAEAMQCDVKWEEESQKVTIMRAGNYLEQKLAVETLAELEVIKPELFKNEENIMRGDCLALIMRATGLMVEGQVHSSYREIRAFTDWDDFSNYRKWMQTGKYPLALGLATSCTNIVDGNLPSTGADLYFDCMRPVTTREAVAFMVRCLNNPTMDLTNEEETFMRALDIGLLKETDPCTSNPDVPIYPNDFFIILYRFLQQPRYLYFETLTGLYMMNTEMCYIYHEANDDTYIDYLEFIVPILKERGEFTHRTNEEPF